MQSPKRVTTGVPGLDAMLSGGFLPQTTNLVEGAPGCGKSTLGMQFIYEGTQRGEPGIILTCEQFPQQFYRDAASFGWDFHELERRNLLRIVMSSPEVTQADLERVGGTLERIITEMGAERILIDSITHFEAATRDPHESGQPDTQSAALRGHIYGMLNALKRQGLTTLLTRETTFLLGEGDDNQVDSGIRFMTDSYILLRYVEIESEVRRAIIILKVRGSAHDRLIRQFEIGPQGMRILNPFEGQEGIMSGTPKRMAESFIKAFVRR